MSLVGVFCNHADHATMFTSSVGLGLAHILRQPRTIRCGVVCIPDRHVIDRLAGCLYIRPSVGGVLQRLCTGLRNPRREALNVILGRSVCRSQSGHAGRVSVGCRWRCVWSLHGEEEYVAQRPFDWSGWWLEHRSGRRTIHWSWRGHVNRPGRRDEHRAWRRDVYRARRRTLHRTRRRTVNRSRGRAFHRP